MINVDLTAPIILNTNPLDISPDIYYDIWNLFQEFLRKKGVVNSSGLNSDKGYSKVGIELIKEFNSNRSIEFSITEKDIKAAQKYHEITNPGKILIDGRLGSQTSQMRYPEPILYYKSDSKNVPLNTNGYIPMIWGNKRYVVTAKIVYDYAIKGLSTPKNAYIIYNPSIHDTLLQKEDLPRIWDTLESQTIINKSAIDINNATKNVVKLKNNIQNQINIIKSIK
jgi:hypothetical protein